MESKLGHFYDAQRSVKKSRGLNQTTSTW